MDDSYDSDFPFPHLDPPELNDIPADKLVGGKPKIEHHHADSEIQITNEDGTTSLEELPF